MPIWDIGRWTLVSETTCDRNGEPIHGKQQGLDRWVEHFMDYFSWMRDNAINPTTATANAWEVSPDPPTEVEVESNIRLLEKGISSGLDERPLILLRLGNFQKREVIYLSRDTWNKQRTSSSCGESLIVSIFKKGAQHDRITLRRSIYLWQ